MGLREIKADLKRYNVRPSKRLGQNFLIDANIQDKILNAVDINKSDIILEIGPGLGALTQGLCARAGKVIAVEKDKRLCGFLQQTYSASNLEILNVDILDYLDVIDIPNGRTKAAGNLPYYISSPIITGLLKKRQSFSSIYVTVQNEFADRLIASPGGKEYASISCFAQFYADIKILFRIKRTCFYPEPRVDSSFVRLVTKERGLCLTDEEKLFKIIRTSFGKRRKTILNSLKSCDLFLSTNEITEALEHAGISHDRRPETVSLEEFIKLTHATESRSSF
ncbi:MAG: ribosomal RNA small subunit methyltransferase A [Candidatus Omnitrophica bacterium]|nr:ribosomal RNA small subunit methyltransferase A [Candidatus Omnitrophota bacterium]